jgi:chromodomain-helicase-DNA-binding protein 7
MRRKEKPPKEKKEKAAQPAAAAPATTEQLATNGHLEETKNPVDTASAPAENESKEAEPVVKTETESETKTDVVEDTAKVDESTEKVNPTEESKMDTEEEKTEKPEETPSVEEKAETAPVVEDQEMTDETKKEVTEPEATEKIENKSEETVEKKEEEAEVKPAVVEEEEEEEEDDISEYEEDGGEIEVEEFFVKYKNLSYLHCEWRTRDELFYSDKRIDQKIKRFKTKKQQQAQIYDWDDECDDKDAMHAKGYNNDYDELFNPDYQVIDRILDESEMPDMSRPGEKLKYYLVKWKSLPYDEASWELESELKNKKKIERFYEINKYVPELHGKYVSKPKPERWVQQPASKTYKNGNSLREYQLEGINWLTFCWLNGRNCILADEMGLGKTVQSITYLAEIASHGIRGPFLVIVPLSTVGNWIKEFETWTDFNVIVYHGSTVSRQMLQDYEFYFKDASATMSVNATGKKQQAVKFNALITTFEVLLTDVALFCEFKWRSCVIDEAHRLKNKNCKLIEGLRYLDVEHKVLLTGTPLQNNVEELFSLLNYLEPAQFKCSNEFLQDFGDLKTDTQVTKLQAVLKPMMLRRLKEDVEKNLAPKEETIVEVELTNTQKKYYRAILEKNFAFLARGATGSNVPNLMNTMMELRKCCNHPYLISGKFFK